MVLCVDYTQLGDSCSEFLMSLESGWVWIWNYLKTSSYTHLDPGVNDWTSHMCILTPYGLASSEHGDCGVVRLLT